MTNSINLVTRTVLSTVALLLLAPSARSDDLADHSKTFFAKNCIACHDFEIKSAGLDLSELHWKPNDPKVFDRWVKLFDYVDTQKMPPPTKKQPDPDVRAEFLKMLRSELHAANLARQQAEGRVVLRRLNRVEYENTLHDLLGIDLPLQHYLPEDSSLHGFDNVSEGLRLSNLHMEQYLEAADVAIAAATDLRRRPTEVKTRFRYHEEESVLNDAKREGKKSFRVLPDAVVVFDDNSPTVLHRFRGGHDRGQYRIRISASAYQAEGRPVWLKLYATDFKTTRLLGFFDLPANEGREVEVIAYLNSSHRTPITTTKARSITTSALKLLPAAAWPSSGWKLKVRSTRSGRRQVWAAYSAIYASSRSSNPDPIVRPQPSPSRPKTQEPQRKLCSRISHLEHSDGP
jgi:hypothetical protein